MRISILVWLEYVPKIFAKQDLAVAKARVVVAYISTSTVADYSRLSSLVSQFIYTYMLIFQESWRWDSSSSSSIFIFV
jgi:hypothetical protein